MSPKSLGTLPWSSAPRETSLGPVSRQAGCPLVRPSWGDSRSDPEPQGKWVYLSFSPLLCASLLFTAICKASSDSHFAFLLRPCSDSSATPSFPSQPEGKIGPSAVNASQTTRSTSCEAGLVSLGALSSHGTSSTMPTQIALSKAASLTPLLHEHGSPLSTTLITARNDHLDS